MLVLVAVLHIAQWPLQPLLASGHHCLVAQAEGRATVVPTPMLVCTMAVK